MHDWLFSSIQWSGLLELRIFLTPVVITFNYLFSVSLFSFETLYINIGKSEISLNLSECFSIFPSNTHLFFFVVVLPVFWY